MQAVATTFPRELEHRWLRDFDHEYAIIAALLYIITLSACLLFSQLQIDSPSREQIERHLDNLLVHATDVQIAPTRVERIVTPKAPAVATNDRQSKIASAEPDRRGGSNADRENLRRNERAKSSEIANSYRSAAGNIGIFNRIGGETNNGGGGDGYGGGQQNGGNGTGTNFTGRGRSALAGLRSGASEGADMKKLTGIGVSEEGAAKARAVRGGGSLVQSSDIKVRLDIAKMTSEELEDVIRKAKVDAPKAPQMLLTNTDPLGHNRTAESVTGKVHSEYIQQIKASFTQFLRQDPSLTGTIQLQITVKADGSIVQPRFASSNWSDSNLGSKVEASILSFVRRWQFPAVTNSSDVTFLFTYSFSR